MDQPAPEVAAIDERVQRVASMMPFHVELDADMGGGPAVLQIDLGRRGGVDDPRDMAGIDPEPNSRWWVDIEGGMKTHVSDLGVEADAATVADWIAQTARAEQSPAAVAGARTEAIRRASYPTSPVLESSAGATITPVATAPERDRGHER